MVKLLNLRKNFVPVWIALGDKFEHARAFDEVGLALVCALKALNYESEIVYRPPRGALATIVLNTYGSMSVRSAIQPNFILFNLEQIPLLPTSDQLIYLRFLKRYTVWDYSAENIRNLCIHGVDAQLCRLGYVDELKAIDKSPVQDIDITFVGAINPRRQSILDRFNQTKTRLFVGSNIYGKSRNDIYARSKVILHIHFYETKIFPIVRMQHLLANSCCVVCERGIEIEMEREFSDAICFVDYAEIHNVCIQLVNDQRRREKYSENGFSYFRSLDQITFVAKALNATLRKLNY
jgi:hypothetical protein